MEREGLSSSRGRNKKEKITERLERWWSDEEERLIY